MGNELKGLIFNIQGFTVHDGPGIRTEIFMKGCPLHCDWCSNPEGLVNHIQPGVDGDKCIGLKECGLCVKGCPTTSLLVSQDDRVVAINRDTCIHCCKCASVCPSMAIKQWGKYYTVEAVMKEIRKDKPFFKDDGGITISGGECLLQHAFVRELCKACKAEGINTCVETTFYTTKEVIDDIFPYVDLFICDIKNMDDEKHRRRCKASNGIILQNIKYVVDKGAKLVIRTPIVPGFNNNDKDITDIGDFIVNELGNKVLQYQLLPFRQMGTEKYNSLNMPYPMEGTEYDRDIWEPEMIRFLDILIGMGINAVTGNNAKMPTG